MEAELFYVLDNCLNINIHIQRKWFGSSKKLMMFWTTQQNVLLHHYDKMIVVSVQMYSACTSG